MEIKGTLLLQKRSQAVHISGGLQMGCPLVNGEVFPENSDMTIDSCHTD